MNKVISIETSKYLNLLSHFENIFEFEKYCGLKQIGTRMLNDKDQIKFKKYKQHKTQVFLFKVIDEKRLSFAKLKYEF
jgi:hypothetical protein